MRSNPHQLLPEPEAIAELRKIAALAWQKRNRGEIIDRPLGFVGIRLPQGVRKVPVLATEGGTEYDAYYDHRLKEIIVNLSKAKDPESIFYALLHESIHASEMLAHPRLADAMIGKAARGYDKVLSPAESRLEYFLREIEVGAYTITFSQVVVDFLDEVATYKHKGSVKAARAIADDLQDALARKDDPLGALDKALHEAMLQLPRTGITDVLDLALASDWFAKYKDERFDLERAFINKVWYAIEDWRRRRAAKK